MNASRPLNSYRAPPGAPAPGANPNPEDDDANPGGIPAPEANPAPPALGPSGPRGGGGPRFRPSSPYASYTWRFVGSLRTSYASPTSLNLASARAFAASPPPACLSGCHFTAILRYAFFSAASSASRATPSVA